MNKALKSSVVVKARLKVIESEQYEKNDIDWNAALEKGKQVYEQCEKNDIDWSVDPEKAKQVHDLEEMKKVPGLLIER